MASLLDRFNNWRKGSVSPTQPVTPPLAAPAPASASSDTLGANVAPPLPSVASLPAPRDSTPIRREAYFAWIENDGLLRDEGVLFGLSGTKPDEKVATIRRYYDRDLARVRARRELFAEHLRQAHEARDTIRTSVVTLREQLHDLTVELPLSSHGFHRTLTGLVSYGLVVIANFWLLYEWLRPEFEQPAIVALGVYAFGLLSLFRPRAYLYDDAPADGPDTQRPLTWKVAVEEFGIPLVAALLPVAWSWGRHPIGQSVALFLFTLFVFLSAGKGLLSSVRRLSDDFPVLGRNRRARRFARQRATEVRAELTRTEARGRRPRPRRRYRRSPTPRPAHRRPAPAGVRRQSSSFPE